MESYSQQIDVLLFVGAKGQYWEGEEWGPHLEHSQPKQALRSKLRETAIEI